MKQKVNKEYEALMRDHLAELKERFVASKKDEFHYFVVRLAQAKVDLDELECSE